MFQTALCKPGEDLLDSKVLAAPHTVALAKRRDRVFEAHSVTV